jgi:hypothetical protein
VEIKCIFEAAAPRPPEPTFPFLSPTPPRAVLSGLRRLQPPRRLARPAVGPRGRRRPTTAGPGAGRAPRPGGSVQNRGVPVPGEPVPWINHTAKHFVNRTTHIRLLVALCRAASGLVGCGWAPAPACRAPSEFSTRWAAAAAARPQAAARPPQSGAAPFARACLCPRFLLALWRARARANESTRRPSESSPA